MGYEFVHVLRGEDSFTRPESRSKSVNDYVSHGHDVHKPIHNHLDFWHYTSTSYVTATRQSYSTPLVTRILMGRRRRLRLPRLLRPSGASRAGLTCGARSRGDSGYGGRRGTRHRRRRSGRRDGSGRREGRGQSDARAGHDRGRPGGFGDSVGGRGPGDRRGGRDRRSGSSGSSGSGDIYIYIFGVARQEGIDSAEGGLGMKMGDRCVSGSIFRVEDE